MAAMDVEARRAELLAQIERIKRQEMASYDRTRCLRAICRKLARLDDVGVNLRSDAKNASEMYGRPALPPRPALYEEED